MTYVDEMIYESMLATNVGEMIYESMRATDVDVMIYESTLENFENAFKGMCSRWFDRSCIAVTDSRILRFVSEGQPEFGALRRGADEDPH